MCSQSQQLQVDYHFETVTLNWSNSASSWLLSAADTVDALDGRES